MNELDKISKQRHILHNFIKSCNGRIQKDKEKYRKTIVEYKELEYKDLAHQITLKTDIDSQAIDRAVFR